MTRDDILAFLSAHRAEIAGRFGVVRIGLFGSFARDEAGEESDVDVAVELEKDHIADRYFGLLHFLEDNLHRKIDLGIESNIKPTLKPYIMKEIIYV